MELTEITVEHPTFDGYTYKFIILWDTECQVFKIFKGWREKCLERWTFSKQQLMYDWINMKVWVFDKDLEKKANPKQKNKKKEEIDILERWPQFII